MKGVFLMVGLMCVIGTVAALFVRVEDLTASRAGKPPAEIPPTPPPPFEHSIGERRSDDGRGIRVDVVTDTATKCQYIVVVGYDCVAITPRLGTPP